jgi:hypothetical protein
MQQLLTTVLVPARPRNLAVTLYHWLRRLGFAVQQQQTDVLTQLHATWADGQGLLFTATYAHHHPEGQAHTGLFSLFVRAADGQSQCLVSATHIRRGGEARLLLLANHFYKNSRQAALAAGVLQPA